MITCVFNLQNHSKLELTLSLSPLLYLCLPSRFVAAMVDMLCDKQAHEDSHTHIHKQRRAIKQKYGISDAAVYTAIFIICAAVCEVLRQNEELYIRR